MSIGIVTRVIVLPDQMSQDSILFLRSREHIILIIMVIMCWHKMREMKLPGTEKETERLTMY